MDCSLPVLLQLKNQCENQCLLSHTIAPGVAYTDARNLQQKMSLLISAGKD